MKFLAITLTCFGWANTYAFPQYRIEFLQDTDGTELRRPLMNDRGDYVASRPSRGGIVAFINGQRHFVMDTSGTAGHQIVDINENGVVAGWTTDGSMFTWSVETGLVELPHPTSGFGQYEVSAINDEGVVIGRWLSDDLSTPIASFTISADRQLTLHNSGYWGHDINNSGRTVGSAGFQNGFYRDLGGVEQFTAPFGNQGRPSVIENDGTMYGWGAPSRSGIGRTAILRWRTPDTVEEIFSGFNAGSFVSSGNGQIATGIAPIQNGISTLHLWSDESGLVNINDLLDEESRALNLVPWVAWDMNGSGMITALVRPTDQSEGFRTAILRPVPEPGTMLALGAGLAALIRRRRAR